MQQRQARRTAIARLGTLVALMVAAAAPPSHAQATDSTRLPSRARSADALRVADSARAAASPVGRRVARIPNGAMLRVAAGRSRLEGRFVHGSVDSVALHQGGRTYAIAAADVDTIWRRRNRGSAGARVGFGIGALGMGLWGAAASGMCESAECRRDAYPGAVFAVLASGLAGAFVGGLLGRALPRWERASP